MKLADLLASNPGIKVVSSNHDDPLLLVVGHDHEGDANVAKLADIANIFAPQFVLLEGVSHGAFATGEKIMERIEYFKENPRAKSCDDFDNEIKRMLGFDEQSMDGVSMLRSPLEKATYAGMDVPNFRAKTMRLTSRASMLYHQVEAELGYPALKLANPYDAVTMVYDIMGELSSGQAARIGLESKLARTERMVARFNERRENAMGNAMANHSCRGRTLAPVGSTHAHPESLIHGAISQAAYAVVDISKSGPDRYKFLSRPGEQARAA